MADAGGTAHAPTNRQGGRAHPDGGAERVHLSDRGIAILRLMAGGYGNRENARTVFLAERGLENHVSDGLAALEARDRTQATPKAITRRLTRVALGLPASFAVPGRPRAALARNGLRPHNGRR